LNEACHPCLDLGFGFGVREQYRYTALAVGLLPARRLRPCCHAAKKCDELASPHSITSSARASSVGGMSVPIVLAVCKFMTNSNLLACSTGRLPGFSPLRMRPA